MATSRARVEIVVARPVAEVFDWLSHYDRNARWQEGVVTSQQVTPGDPRVGTVVRYVRTVLGQKVETEATIVELVPERRLRARSENRLFTYLGGYDLDAVPGGTRVVYEGEIATGALLGFVGRSVAGKFQEQMEGDLGRLKAVLERGPPV
jgi:uncharacterized protein YndB with AHSA1/START domain